MMGKAKRESNILWWMYIVVAWLSMAGTVLGAIDWDKGN